MLVLSAVFNNLIPGLSALFLSLGYFLRKNKKQFILPTHQSLCLAFAAAILLFIIDERLVGSLNAIYSFSSLPLMLLFFVSEEVFFRIFLKERLGAYSEVLIYTALMPFLYARSFFDYLAYALFFFFLSVICTILSDINRLNSPLLRVFMVFFFFYYKFTGDSALPLTFLILFLPFAFLFLEGLDKKEAERKLGLGTLGVKSVSNGVSLFVLSLFITILLSLFLNLLGLNDSAKVTREIQSHGLPLILLAVTLAPIGEELFFRSYLLNRIGITLSTVLFAALHYGYGSVAEIVGALVFGGLFAYYMQKNKDIYACIIAHSLFNLISLIAILRIF